MWDKRKHTLLAIAQHVAATGSIPKLFKVKTLDKNGIADTILNVTRCGELIYDSAENDWFEADELLFAMMDKRIKGNG